MVAVVSIPTRLRVVKEIQLGLGPAIIPVLEALELAAAYPGGQFVDVLLDAAVDLDVPGICRKDDGAVSSPHALGMAVQTEFEAHASDNMTKIGRGDLKVGANVLKKAVKSFDELDAIFATSTVAAGVDFPARSVVITGAWSAMAPKSPSEPGSGRVKSWL